MIKQAEFGESIGDLSALSPPFESTTSYGRTTSYQTLKQAVPLEELLAVRTAARYLQWNVNSSSDSQANGEFGRSVYLVGLKILERYVLVSTSEIKAEREQSDHEIDQYASNSTLYSVSFV